MNHLVSMKQLTEEEIMALLERAETFKKYGVTRISREIYSKQFVFRTKYTNKNEF